MTSVRYVVLCVALLVVGGAPAHAGQPSTTTSQAQSGPPAPTNVRPGVPVEPPRAQRGSGFWTSNRPAKGGSYRYRLLLIGLAVFLAMLALMVRIIRSRGTRESE